MSDTVLGAHRLLLLVHSESRHPLLLLSFRCAGERRVHGVQWQSTGLDPLRHAFGVRSTSGVHNAMSAIINPAVAAADAPTTRIGPKVRRDGRRNAL